MTFIQLKLQKFEVVNAQVMIVHNCVSFLGFLISTVLMYYVI